MLDITTIILTYNEEIHIRRCLENVCPFSKKVIVVDSPSTDRTVDICNEFAQVEVVVHKYPGNQAEQFNWALDNLNIETEWILRLDADEYLFPDLIDELYEKLPKMSNSVSALSLSLSRAFCGKVLHHGIVNNIRIIRIFRKDRARYEKRLMDEHLSVLSGEIVELEHQFVDDNLMTFGQFTVKHNNYASREAAILLDAEFNLTTVCKCNGYSQNVEKKREQKAKYAKMPLFWRSFAYFIYRYIVKLGFLDGIEGFCWDFFQGLWYRMLVDAKVYEARRNCNLQNIKRELTESEKNSVKQYIKRNWNISL